MKKKINYRLIVQVGFFALISLISVNHFLVEKGIVIPFISSASIHALCPYGGVETFISFITAGTLVKKVHESAIVLLGIIMLLAVLFGPVFCSYICPLGSLQEWLSKIGEKIFKNKYNKFIPKKLDKYLRYTRYLVLIITVYLSTMSLKLVFEAYDPYYALFNFWTGDVAITALIVLVVVILSSLFIERAWCKYACPFGALLGITNLFKIFKVRRNQTTCTSCNNCTNDCPMNIEVSNKEVVVDHQCISCGICTSEKVCPIDKTVTISKKTTPLKNYGYLKMSITILLVLIVGISVGKLANVFITESTKTPNQIAAGEFKDEYDPSDISGSYSFSDISNSFDISVDTLARAFNVDTTDNGDFQIKSLEELYDNVGTSSVKQFVALYTGLPYDEESDGLPISAIELLLNEDKITKDEYISLIDMQETYEIEEGADGVEEESHTSVNSTTTIKEAIELGIELEVLESIMGTKITDINMTIKDLSTENGLKFSEIKDEINNLL